MKNFRLIIKQCTINLVSVLFILHNNLFDNQRSEINKNDIFCTFRHTVFYEKVLPTLLYSLSLSLYIIYMYKYIFIYILYDLPSVLIHVLPFFNRLKITLKVQSSTQTKIKPFYCTKFVIAPVKGFHLVRETPECNIEFLK